MGLVGVSMVMTMVSRDSGSISKESQKRDDVYVK